MMRGAMQADNLEPVLTLVINVNGRDPVPMPG
jgi:hypothetical protein